MTRDLAPRSTPPGSLFPAPEVTIRDVCEYVIVDDFEGSRKNGKSLSYRASDGRVLVNGETTDELVARFGDPWEVAT